MCFFIIFSEIKFQFYYERYNHTTLDQTQYREYNKRPDLIRRSNRRLVTEKYPHHFPSYRL